jgi:hypothetical protein
MPSPSASSLLPVELIHRAISEVWQRKVLRKETPGKSPATANFPIVLARNRYQSFLALAKR